MHNTVEYSNSKEVQETADHWRLSLLLNTVQPAGKFPF